MKPFPIRWKIALWSSALLGVALILFAGGTYLNLYHEQIEAVDLELEAAGKHLASFDDNALSERKLDELLRFQPWLAGAIFNARGELIRRSPNLPEDLTRAALIESKLHTARHGSERWRLTTVRRTNTTIVLAYDLVEVREIVHDLLIAYALSLPLVLVVAAFGGWWVAGRALGPLRELATAAETIRAEHLSRRVPEFRAVDEIQRLAVVLNAMLGRLEGSFAQARRFAADASHELRTPLTIMHGEIEALVHTPGIDTAQQRKLVSLQEEIGRLNRITEQLLLLARFDAGGKNLMLERVDFSALVSAACEDIELLASVSEISLKLEIVPGVYLEGDSAHLRRLLLNLLDNSVGHNHLNGKVTCRLQTTADAAILTIGNSGSGIPVEARAQLFRRFFRADSARTRGGHGLGLSLSREIARAHGGDLTLNSNSPAGWTEFVVTLPAFAEQSS
ncbi:MAG: ATP-binding protein [Opitutaceae bacterium]|nr:ATP-binding protein [Opitutaceae bacterium]